MFMRSNNKRVFISLYFSDLVDHRKKRDFTLSFNKDDPIYKKCKNMGSNDIKKIININTYKKLLKEAKKEERSLGNYIKFKLKMNLLRHE